MKISYIYHSGFMVETESATLLFDYFKGKLPAFPVDKPLIIFASHKHKDHFSFRVFELENHPGGVSYIFGNDIKFTDRYLERHGIDPGVKDNIIRMQPHTTLELPISAPGQENERNSIKIHTLKSTDAGVAFCVQTAEGCIFHAGDLNLWHWNGETEEFNRGQEKAYQAEIQYLKTWLEKEAVNVVDVAFLPLDPRLGEAYVLGADYFLGHIPVKMVYPMHMWDDYDVVNRYIAHCEADGEKTLQTFKICEHSFFTKQT